eukprot:SAG25_NODE_379_length_8822_cov_7.896366_1_plen_131_part_00
MYGSHYSSPSVVMLYLLRRIPDCFLHLQSGRFGAPDRLFHSVEASWRSSLESDTDVKELVPEFYNTRECVGEFLLNTHSLQLGVTQDGDAIGACIGSPCLRHCVHGASIARMNGSRDSERCRGRRDPKRQ